MTRAEIERDYKIENGIIRSPGKFEGESIYVPHFWNEFLNGFADDDIDGVLSFRVIAEDRAEFPELRDRRMVKIMQRDDGFVCEVQ